MDFNSSGYEETHGVPLGRYTKHYWVFFIVETYSVMGFLFSVRFWVNLSFAFLFITAT